MSGKNGVELTLAIIKPHVLKVPGALAIIHRYMVKHGFHRIKCKMVTINASDLESFYAEHKNKFYYNRLMASMRSGPSQICILARKDAILKWRVLMGPTKVSKARYTHPETIRAELGLTDTRNAVHGSDSIESAKREINIMFPDFDISDWYKNEAKLYESDDLLHDSNAVPIFQLDFPKSILVFDRSKQL